MPDFYYKAADKQGEISEGIETASSAEWVSLALKKRGLIPITVSNANASLRTAAKTAHNAPKLKAETQLVFTRELATLLQAGMSLNRALKLLEQLFESAEGKTLVAECRREIKQGRGLSQALENYESSFGQFYITLLKAGEASGHLAEVLGDLSQHMQEVQALQTSVKSALIYPFILILFAIVSLAIMILFVIPEFESIFNDMGDALPLPTKMLMGLSNTLREYGWIVLLLFLAGVIALYYVFKSTAGKQRLQSYLLRLPLLGKLIRTYQTSRFTRTLATLLHNDVSLVRALSIAKDTVTHQDIKAPLETLIPAVKQGNRLSNTLEKTQQFSPLMVQMIRVGEETGSLDKQLYKLSDIYDHQVKEGVKRSLIVLEPALILGLGFIIALMIMSILLGVLSVNEFVF